MASFIDNFSPKQWEEFCEIMLRHNFGNRYFTAVPDDDRGDCGLEFFTIEGTIFQSYYPDPGVEMSVYKRKVQNKINTDLKKLKQYESEILEILDDIKIHQWVLLIPENKSKDLIKYCNKKKNETIKKNILFLDNEKFIVKIETADSYPAGKLFAQQVWNIAIDIPIQEITSTDKEKWMSENTEFLDNVIRKSNALMGNSSESFKDRVITKYIQIEGFLDQLRDEHPDLHELVEDSARAQLDNIQDESVLEKNLDSTFIQNVVDENKQSFSKHSCHMSENNMQLLSFGYLSKWLAECYMDFKK